MSNDRSNSSPPFLSVYYALGTMLGIWYRQMHGSPSSQEVYILMRKIKYKMICHIIAMKNFTIQSFKGVMELP